MPRRSGRKPLRSPAPEPAAVPRRSHAPAALAVVVLLIGLVLGTWTVVLPALLGLFLFSSGISFLGTRLNPFSIGYYLTTKPSWSAIAVVFLSGFLLWVAAYAYYVHGLAPLIPGRLH